MEKYIEGNKAAWEEAFENRDPSWGADVSERISKEEYAFFNKETADVLKKLETQPGDRILMVRSPGCVLLYALSN